MWLRNRFGNLNLVTISSQQIVVDDEKDPFPVDRYYETIEVTMDQLRIFPSQKFCTFPNADIRSIPDMEKSALEISSDCRVGTD